MKIQSTKDIKQFNIKAIIFGQSSSGKTTLAASLKKVLVISAEGGLLSIANRDIDYIDITKNEEGELCGPEERMTNLFNVYKMLQEDEYKNKYENIYIDSLSEIGSQLVAKLQLEYPEAKDGLVMWGKYNKDITQLIKAFRDLPYYNVFFTALSTIDEDENKKRFVGIQLNGSISSRLPQYFDEVFYLGIGEDEKRFILTSATEKILAKDRSGKLEKFEEAHLGNIINKIQGVENV